MVARLRSILVARRAGEGGAAGEPNGFVGCFASPSESYLDGQVIVIHLSWLEAVSRIHARRLHAL